MEEKAIRGIPWTLLTLAGGRVITICGTLVLARLLVPADFGLVALGLTLAILVGLFSSLGLGGVFIVERDLDARAKGTYLSMFLLMGVGFALALAAISPLLARAFGEPRLVGVVLGLSATVFLSGGLNWFYEAVMQRELEFRNRFLAQMVQAVSYSGTAVALAFLGAGVWSLVAGQVAGAFLYAVALVALAPYRVRPTFDWETARNGIRAGRGFLVQGVSTYVAQNVDFLIVGRVLGARQLGFYSMAYRLSEMPNWFIAESVAKVTFPGFTRMRHRGEDVVPAFLSALRLVAFVTCPLGILLSASADVLTRVALGDRWLGMVGALTALGLWGAVKPLRATVGWLLNSVGAAGVFAKVSVLTLVPLVAAITAAARWSGIAAVGWIILAEASITLVALAFLAQRRAGVPLREQWLAVRPVALACPAAWAATRAVSEAAAPDALGLAAALAAGAAAYLLVIAAIEPALPGYAVAQAKRMMSRRGLAATAS